MRSALVTSVGLLVLATACASSPPPAVTPPPPPPPPPSATTTAASAPPKDAIVTLHAGAMPSSMAHMWGRRAFDLRRTEKAWVVRVHDRRTFQGYGMSKPAPQQDLCTAWEELPGDVAGDVPTADELDCESGPGKALCERVRAHLEKTRPAKKPVDDSAPYDPRVDAAWGRAPGGC